MTRLRGRQGDAGSSLTELIVVMFILSFVVVTTVTLTIGLQRTTAENISRQDQIDVGRTAVERMSKTLRAAVKPSQLVLSCPGCVADAFIQAGDFTIQYYSNLNNEGNLVGPSRVSYTVPTTGPDAGTLLEKVQVPDSHIPTAYGYQYCAAESPSASQACKDRLTVRQLATNVLVDTGRPVFSYFDGVGDPLATGGTQLDATELANLLSVELTLTVRSTNASRPADTTYIQRIMLPNTEAILRP